MANIETFKYKKMRPVGFILASVVVAICAWISILSIQRYPVGQYLPVLLFFVPVAICVSALSVFLYRDVVVSNCGIRRPFLGSRGRLVAWHEMTCLRCVGVASDGKTANGYLILTKLGFPVVGILVISLIDRGERLSEVIGAEFLKRELPVVAWRSGVWMPLDHLPRLKRSSY
jgi:hypothetical protein